MLRSTLKTFTQRSSFARFASSHTPLYRDASLKSYDDYEGIMKHAPLVRRDIPTEQLGGFKVTVSDKATHNVDKKTLWDSYLEVTFPLSTNEASRAHFSRASVPLTRFGRIFEVLDILSGEVAYKHVLGGFNPPCKSTLVTASIDGITFEDALIPVDKDLTFRAYLTNVGSSSMEVRTEIFSENTFIGDGFFTFVALDSETFKPVRVPQLLASCPEDEVFLAKGKERTKARKTRLINSLERTHPNAEESKLMHQIWKNTNRITGPYTIEPVKGDIRDIVTNPNAANVRDAVSPLPADKEVFLYPPQAFAQKADGFVDYVMMGDTKISAAQVMQPNHQNVHHKMFGGYLARKAFETSWVCAQRFFNTPYPTLSGVDNIFFTEPVEVGYMIDNVARVVLTTPDEVHIQVDSIMRDPKTGKTSVTNLFHFYYRPDTILKAEDKKPHVFNSDAFARPKMVVPRSYEEYLTYLDARRRYLARRNKD